MIEPWAQRVYENDKRAAALCRRMSENGFGFDAQRARALSDRLRDLEHDARNTAERAVGRTIVSTESGGFATSDLQRAFFEDLGAPVFFRSVATGAPSLGVDTLRAYAAARDPRLRALSLAILEWRRARKVRSTYVDNVHLGSDGRVHPSWLSYGAVSGRWACQGPNIMNLPRRENDPTRDVGGVRSLYVARPGHVLATFDAKQLEMRIAAYASGDPAMIAACESSDLHAANAAVIFGESFAAADPAKRALRTLAKSAGFAVCYMAEAATVYARIVAAGADVTLRQVEAMLAKMRRGFHVYYRWQDARLMACVRTAYTDDPLLGRRRWLGHDPSPTECANFPIQAGAAALMGVRLPAIVEALDAARIPCYLVAQVHDSAVFEVKAGAAQPLLAVAREVFEAPCPIASSGRELRPSFPIDVEVSTRWH